MRWSRRPCRACASLRYCGRHAHHRGEVPRGLVELAHVPHDVHVAHVVAVPRSERCRDRSTTSCSFYFLSSDRPIPRRGFGRGRYLLESKRSQVDQFLWLAQGTHSARSGAKYATILRKQQFIRARPIRPVASTEIEDDTSIAVQHAMLDRVPGAIQLSNADDAPFEPEVFHALLLHRCGRRYSQWNRASARYSPRRAFVLENPPVTQHAPRADRVVFATTRPGADRPDRESLREAKPIRGFQRTTAVECQRPVHRRTNRPPPQVPQFGHSANAVRNGGRLTAVQAYKGALLFAAR